MSYVVTGAAGFIGSNLVRALNDRGVTDILAVDDLRDGDKFVNLADCEIDDYVDKERFIELVREGALDGDVDVVMHQGACSDTTERDGRYMMNNNYEYSKALLEFCTDARFRSFTLPARRFMARARRSARTRNRRRRSMYMAIPSFSSTSTCGAMRPAARRRLSDCATSTCMAAASSTRDGCRRLLTISSTSTVRAEA